MASITVVDGSGNSRAIEGELGISLMEILREHGFDGLPALCGGCCSCATCHVYIDRSFETILPAMSEDEDALLDGSEHRRESSRLSCQVKFAQAMDGMTVMIVPEG